MAPREVRVDYDCERNTDLAPVILKRLGKKALDARKNAGTKFPTSSWMESLVDKDGQEYNVTFEVDEPYLVVTNVRKNKAKPKRK